MSAAGDHLKDEGHIYYLSTGGVGLLSIVDASGAPSFPCSALVGFLFTD